MTSGQHVNNCSKEYAVWKCPKSTFLNKTCSQPKLFQIGKLSTEHYNNISFLFNDFISKIMVLNITICAKSVADSEICARGGPMTMKLMAWYGGHLFLTSFNREMGLGLGVPGSATIHSKHKMYQVENLK